MNIFGIKNNVIEYTVNKADNKGIYISVQNGEVLVNAPWYVTSNQIQEVVEQKMKEGILGRDKPDQIISAKRHIDLPRELLCEISWKKRKNNTTPLNSFYLNSEIKKYHPMLLVNYYEEHLIFPKRKDKKEHYYK